MKISTPAAVLAQHQMYTVNKGLTKLAEQITTGKKINRAQDGAAEMAISQKLNAQVRGLQVAMDNAKNGQAALKIAEGTFDQLSAIVTQQRDLAIRGSDATMSQGERDKLAQEYNALNDEIKRISQNATFNGMSVIDNAASEKFGVGGSQLQVGAFAGGANVMTVSYAGITTSGITNLSATAATQANFSTAIDTADALLKSFATDRTTIGVSINRLDYTINNLANMKSNSEEALSTIQDLDYSKASADSIKLQVQQQMASTALQLINSLPQSVLSLF